MPLLLEMAREGLIVSELVQYDEQSSALRFYHGGDYMIDSLSQEEIEEKRAVPEDYATIGLSRGTYFHLLDIAQDHTRMVEENRQLQILAEGSFNSGVQMMAERDALRAEVERLQGYIDERDVEIVRLHHARADALNAANARIEKLERVRKAAQSLSLAVDDPHACAVIDSDNRLLKAALAALAACDEEGGK